uniref:Uncharacterized protein n=1 Tax=Amphimedon queenslandica TaxID=400682 RepID=A0A1X7T192_AMPQE
YPLPLFLRKNDTMSSCLSSSAVSSETVRHCRPLDDNNNNNDNNNNDDDDDDDDKIIIINNTHNPVLSESEQQWPFKKDVVQLPDILWKSIIILEGLHVRLYTED